MKRMIFSSAVLLLTAASLMSESGPGSAAAGGAVFANSEPRPPANPVPRTFFGMHRHVWPNRPEPWPDIPIGSFRLWDSNTGWAQINPSEGHYDWSQVDKWFADLQQHNVEDVLYTFGRTPQFASSQPNNAQCGYGPGQCAPPKDLKPDGTGSDEYWKTFVTAIATHSKNNPGIHIKYWELWNEPYLPVFWTGTIPQLLRMARDAREIIHSIDPDAVFLSPPSGMMYPKPRQFMDDWLAAGGGQYADGISFHGYVQGAPATDFIKYYAEFRKILAKYGQDSKPTYDTEASWGEAEKHGFTDEDLQAAYITQFYLVHWSQGVKRLYWYAFNNGDNGKLWNREQKTITKAARAYRELFNWLVGSTMTKACAPDGSIWTCNITRADGTEAVIVWNQGGETSYTPKGAWKKFRDGEGQESTISGPVKLGPKPLLLESK